MCASCMLLELCFTPASHSPANWAAEHGWAIPLGDIPIACRWTEKRVTCAGIEAYGRSGPTRIALLFLPNHSGGFTRRKEQLPDKGADRGPRERSNPEQPELTNCGTLREQDDRSRASRVDRGIGHRNRNKMNECQP